MGVEDAPFLSTQHVRREAEAPSVSPTACKHVRSSTATKGLAGQIGSDSTGSVRAARGRGRRLGRGAARGRGRGPGRGETRGLRSLRRTPSESAGRSAARREHTATRQMSLQNRMWEGGSLYYSSLLLSLYCASGCARSGFYERLGSRGAAVAVYFPLNTLL